MEPGENNDPGVERPIDKKGKVFSRRRVEGKVNLKSRHASSQGKEMMAVQQRL